MGAEQRVRESFARQRVMATLGATLHEVREGRVVVGLPFRADLTQQHGFVHAGILATILDSACGYAALSTMDAGTGVLAVEFKINLLRPAVGARFVATGTVVKPGRTITVCRGDVHAIDDGGAETHVAIGQASMMCVRDRGLHD